MPPELQVNELLLQVQERVAEIARLERKLKAAMDLLRRMEILDTECECLHEDENCCARVADVPFCAHCYAAMTLQVLKGET